MEPKVAWAAGAWNNDFPKVKVDWLLGAAVVEAVLVMANPPNEAVVAFWVGGAWPNANTFWLAA